MATRDKPLLGARGLQRSLKNQEVARQAFTI